MMMPGSGENCQKDRNIYNRKCGFQTAQEEIDARYKVAAETLKVYRRYLPGILKDLSKIEDLRDPQKVEHSLDVLMLYGIFLFVFQLSSRREANREMTEIFMENMRQFFPELDSLPHADTLARVLEVIEVNDIEAAAFNLINRLIRDKKFSNFMVGSRYVIAIDGTQKLIRDWEWSENCLQKHIKGQPEEVKQYYASALEASFVLPRGLTIPFMTEFLDRKEHPETGAEGAKLKQDCQLKAFYRLAERLKACFPRLLITLTMDGLYANGPLMELCQKYGWDYMIVLKDGSLKTVWEDIEGLKREDRVDSLSVPLSNGIKQTFWWVNNIDYTYRGQGIKVNVVICEETTVKIERETGREIQETKKFAWLSMVRINECNVEKRCNPMGRPRWNIETQNLVEKHQGYAYEHNWSYDWNGMKGFHYLMHLGHILNILTLYSSGLIGKVKERGVRGTIKLIWLIFKSEILDYERLNLDIQGKYQVRLVI